MEYTYLPNSKAVTKTKQYHVLFVKTAEMKVNITSKLFLCLNLSILHYCQVGHHFQSSSDDEDDFKPISFLHTESSLQQV